MKRRTVTLLGLGMVTMASLATLPAFSAPRFKVGEPFPDRVFPALEDGRPTSLERFRGRPLALHIFASW